MIPSIYCFNVPTNSPEPRRTFNSQKYGRILFVVLKYNPTDPYRKIDEIINLVQIPVGYKAHRFIKCGNFFKHLYVCYTEDFYASQAMLFLKTMDSMLYVEKLDVYLELLFTLQMGLGINTMWSPAYIDGFRGIHSPPFREQLSFLGDFGRPKIVFRKSISCGTDRLDHAYVCFTSPAEALGAAIYNGTWLRATVDGNLEEVAIGSRYRIKLEQGSNFKFLLLGASSFSESVYSLEYFYKDGDWDMDIPSRSNNFPRNTSRRNRNHHRRGNRRNLYPISADHLNNDR